jgi:hypothetical protein
MTHDKAFDGDISTYFEAKERTGAWTGLDFGKPHRIFFFLSSVIFFF